MPQERKWEKCWSFSLVLSKAMANINLHAMGCMQNWAIVYLIFSSLHVKLNKCLTWTIDLRYSLTCSRHFLRGTTREIASKQSSKSSTFTIPLTIKFPRNCPLPLLLELRLFHKNFVDSPAILPFQHKRLLLHDISITRLLITTTLLW